MLKIVFMMSLKKWALTQNRYKNKTFIFFLLNNEMYDLIISLISVIKKKHIPSNFV